MWSRIKPTQIAKKIIPVTGGRGNAILPFGPRAPTVHKKDAKSHAFAPTAQLNEKEVYSGSNITNLLWNLRYLSGIKPEKMVKIIVPAIGEPCKYHSSKMAKNATNTKK